MGCFVQISSLCHWADPQNFLYTRSDIRQVRFVLEGGHATLAHDSLNVSKGLCLGLGIGCKIFDTAVKGGRCGLGSGFDHG